MKTVTYPLTDGTTHTVEYDENAPCWMCGEPVVEASMGGTVICPWCDCGYHRDGRKWSFRDLVRASERYKENKERHAREGRTMKITHDSEADAIYIQLRDGIAYSHGEDVGRITIDIGEDGEPVGIKILGAKGYLLPDV